MPDPRTKNQTASPRIAYISVHLIQRKFATASPENQKQADDKIRPDDSLGIEDGDNDDRTQIVGNGKSC